MLEHISTKSPDLTVSAAHENLGIFQIAWHFIFILQIRTKMKTAYQIASKEKGKGSHQRRCKLLEEHVSGLKEEIFVDATKPLLEGLEGLLSEIEGLLHDRRKSLEESLKSFVQGDMMQTTLQQKKAILAKVQSSLTSARSALDFFQVHSCGERRRMP